MDDEPRAQKSDSSGTPGSDSRPVWVQAVVGLLMGAAALAILYVLMGRLL